MYQELIYFEKGNMFLKNLEEVLPFYLLYSCTNEFKQKTPESGL